MKYFWSLNPLPIFAIFKTEKIKKNWIDLFGKLNGDKVDFRASGDFYICYDILKIQKFVVDKRCIHYSRLHETNSIDHADLKKKLTIFNIV